MNSQELETAVRLKAEFGGHYLKRQCLWDDQMEAGRDGP